MLAGRKNYQNHFEALMFEEQCIPGLAAVAKKLREILASHEKADAPSKTAAKGRGKNRAATASKRLTTPDKKLANAKAIQLELVEVAIRTEADANKARTDQRNSQHVSSESNRRQSCIGKTWI